MLVHLWETNPENELILQWLNFFDGHDHHHSSHLSICVIKERKGHDYMWTCLNTYRGEALWGREHRWVVAVIKEHWIKQNFLLTVVKARILRLGCPHGQVLSEGHPPHSQMSFFSLYLHTLKGRRSSVYGPFYKALIPFMRTLSSWTNYLPKCPPPNTITWGIRPLPYEFEGDTDIHSVHSMCVCMCVCINQFT